MNQKQILLNVKTTLESLDIKPTKLNCDKLLGCMIWIEKIIEEIERKEENADVRETE